MTEKNHSWKRAENRAIRKNKLSLSNYCSNHCKRMQCSEVFQSFSEHLSNSSPDLSSQMLLHTGRVVISLSVITRIITVYFTPRMVHGTQPQVIHKSVIIMVKYLNIDHDFLPIYLALFSHMHYHVHSSTALIRLSRDSLDALPWHL